MYNNYISILYECKIEILTGIFAGLAVYSYFYKLKLKTKIEIKSIKNKLENKRPMSEDRFNFIEKTLERIECYMKERLERIESNFRDHITENEDMQKRLVKLEQTNAITRREIALYVTIGTFVLLQILDKINII